MMPPVNVGSVMLVKVMTPPVNVGSVMLVNSLLVRTPEPTPLGLPVAAPDIASLGLLVTAPRFARKWVLLVYSALRNSFSQSD